MLLTGSCTFNQTLQAEEKGEVGTTGAEGELMKKAPKTFHAGPAGMVTCMLYEHEST